jgi:hypothetical protein
MDEFQPSAAGILAKPASRAAMRVISEGDIR